MVFLTDGLANGSFSSWPSVSSSFPGSSFGPLFRAKEEDEEELVSIHHRHPRLRKKVPVSGMEEEIVCNRW